MSIVAFCWCYCGVLFVVVVFAFVVSCWPLLDVVVRCVLFVVVCGSLFVVRCSPVSCVVCCLLGAMFVVGC